MKSDEKTRRASVPDQTQSQSTPEEKIAFLIRLAQLDLDQLREGDRLNLFADLRSLFGVETKSKSLEDLRGPQEKVREELQRVSAINAFNRRIGRPEDRPFASIVIHPAVTRSLTFQAVPGEGTRAFGDVRPVVLWNLYDTITRVDARHVRGCQAQDCERLFFAEHGNQFFCTPKCANREASRRFREAKAQPKKRRPSKRHGNRSGSRSERGGV